MKPQQKTGWPETANQEVGWYTQHYNQVKPRNQFGHQNFWVSDWNADYVRVQGNNPYVKDEKNTKNFNFSIKDNQMYKDAPPVAPGKK